MQFNGVVRTNMAGAWIAQYGPTPPGQRTISGSPGSQRDAIKAAFDFAIDNVGADVITITIERPES